MRKIVQHSLPYRLVLVLHVSSANFSLFLTKMSCFLIYYLIFGRRFSQFQCTFGFLGHIFSRLLKLSLKRTVQYASCEKDTVWISQVHESSYYLLCINHFHFDCFIEMKTMFGKINHYDAFSLSFAIFATWKQFWVAEIDYSVFPAIQIETSASKTKYMNQELLSNNLTTNRRHHPSSQ